MAGFKTTSVSANLLERDLIGEKLALSSAGCYALIFVGSYCLASAHLAHLLPREREAAGIAFAVQLACVAPRAFQRLTSARGPRTGSQSFALMVNAISMASNLAMFLWPMPIVVDPTTHTRNHLARWSQWSVLAGSTMFAVEAVDATSFWWPLALGVSIGASTFSAMILPFIRNRALWNAVLGFAFVTYGAIFPRLRYKMRELAAMGESAHAEALERKIRLGAACRLLGSCAAMWTVFVANYFVAWAGQAWHIAGSGAAYPQWPFVLDCFIDVFCKLVFTDIIHEGLHAARQLYEEQQARARKRDSRYSAPRRPRGRRPAATLCTALPADAPRARARCVRP